MTNNKQNETRPLHEKIFEEHGINPEEIYKKEGNKEQLLPREWVQEIIRFNAENIQINYESIEENKGRIRVNFSNKSDANTFREAFNKNLIKNLNLFIKTVKNNDPKKYHRNITFSMNEETPIVVIEF